MYELFFSFLSWTAIISGSFFVVVGAVGFFRFKNFWTRIHAASVHDSAGMLLLIIGMCLHSGLNLITVKLILIGIFLLVTGPTATHAIANAAMIAGLGKKSSVSENNVNSQ
jgi:multicomponent Na+:H+ antiporter subunit G